MAATKRLYRSRRNKVLGGVCGGLGEYFDIDPSLIRLIWVLVFFMGGSGGLIYIIFWVVLPEGENETKKVKEVQDDKKK